jgi:hypothetical protein
MGPAESVFDALITTDQNLRYQQTTLAADMRFSSSRPPIWLRSGIGLLPQIAGPFASSPTGSQATSMRPATWCSRTWSPAPSRRLGAFPQHRYDLPQACRDGRSGLLFFMRARALGRVVSRSVSRGAGKPDVTPLVSLVRQRRGLRKGPRGGTRPPHALNPHDSVARSTAPAQPAPSAAPNTPATG